MIAASSLAATASVAAPSSRPRDSRSDMALERQSDRSGCGEDQEEERGEEDEQDQRARPELYR